MAEHHDILWAIMEDPRASAASKCVATVLLLKFRNHETRVCNPSFGTIAKCVGRKRRSVIDAVNELKGLGWVRWTGTLGGSTENTNQFDFSLPVQSAAPVQDTTPVQCSAATGAAERTIPVQYTAHELSIKPSKNQSERARTRATLIPDDFRLTDEDYAWALDLLGSPEKVDRSLTRFVDHCRQVIGRQAYSRDWQAKSRLWISDDARRPTERAIEVKGSRISAIDLTKPSETEFRGVLAAYKKLGRWTRHKTQFGPAPGKPGCIVPDHLLAEYGITKEAAA